MTTRREAIEAQLRADFCTNTRTIQQEYPGALADSADQAVAEWERDEPDYEAAARVLSGNNLVGHTPWESHNEVFRDQARELARRVVDAAFPHRQSPRVCSTCGGEWIGHCANESCEQHTMPHRQRTEEGTE